MPELSAYQSLGEYLAAGQNQLYPQAPAQQMQARQSDAFYRAYVEQQWQAQNPFGLVGATLGGVPTGPSNSEVMARLQIVEDMRKTLLERTAPPPPVVEKKPAMPGHTMRAMQGGWDPDRRF